ncbi:head decoration protein [Rhizobium ruizarguesonis]
MPVFTDDGRREGDYEMSGSAGATGGMRSRDQGILLAGTVGKSGMVVGLITASGKYTPLNTAAADGSQTAAGILFSNVDASAADKRAVFHVREMEAHDAKLIWPAGISAPNKAAAIAALKTKGIIVRT